MSRRRTLAIWSVLLAYSAVHFLAGVGYAWNVEGGDLLSAFPGLLMFRAAQHWPALAKAWIEPTREWNYGPAVQVLTLPFIVASSKLQATRVILVIDYVLVAATFVMWMRLIVPERRHLVLSIAVLCVWLNHFPLLEAIAGREVEIIELFLITVAIMALRRGREVLAGVAVGVAAMIKFLPAIFIPYLFVKGFTKGGWVAVATVVAFAVFGQVALGWDQSVTLAMLQLNQTGNDQANHGFPTAYANQALTNVLYKMFTAFNIDDPRPPTLYPHALRTIGSILSYAVIAATAWFVVRWRRSPLLELEWALLAIVMCLVPPHANTYYFLFALPALSLGVAALVLQPRTLDMPPKVALFAAIALMGFLLPMRAFEIATNLEGKLIARALQGWSLPAFGAMLAAGLMVELHRVARRAAP